MADKDKVIGKALYLEFRSGTNTYQTIVLQMVCQAKDAKSRVPCIAGRSQE